MSNSDQENKITKYYQPSAPAYSEHDTTRIGYGSTYPGTVYLSTDIDSLTDQEINCYRLSKTVRIFAIIDIFFGLLYLFFNYYFLIPLLIAFIGYHGAKNYISCSVLTYAIYQIVNNLLRLGFTIYSYVKIREDNNVDDYSKINGQLAITVLLVMLGLYIARFSYKLWKVINRLSGEQILSLLSVDYPIQIIWW